MIHTVDADDALCCVPTGQFLFALLFGQIPHWPNLKRTTYSRRDLLNKIKFRCDKRKNFNIFDLFALVSTAFCLQKAIVNLCKIFK